MKLQTVITLEEALESKLIDESDHKRLTNILEEALYETHRKTSYELTDVDLEKLNAYITRNYDSSILRIMKDFRFNDLTETFNIRPSVGSLRLIEFDKTTKDVKAKIILQSIELKMLRVYDCYIVTHYQELYGSQCITFKMHDNLSIGSFDEV